MTAARLAAWFFVGASLAGCGEKYSRDCSIIEGDVTYARVQEVFEEHCTRCHGTDKSGNEREGAPSVVNYDSYEEAMENAEPGNDAVLAGTMPADEPDAISDAEGCLIEKWIEEDYPQ